MTTGSALVRSTRRPGLTPYSIDLRERVPTDRDGGMGAKAEAEKFSVSPSWVRKLKRQRRETGSISSDQANGTSELGTTPNRFPSPRTGSSHLVPG